jgi:hypothetical protein
MRHARLLRLVASPASLGALVLAGAPQASLADTLAMPCDDEPYLCMSAPMHFEKTDAAPFEFDFDTGWIPGGSPLQVHLFGGLYANTEVELDGSLVTKWPEALTLATPGVVDGGRLAFHYGLEVGAEGKIEVQVFGQTLGWQGDLPYLPQVDFQVEGEEIFDTWAFSPAAVLTASTLPVTLASIGLGDLVGGSIPGLDGGFELDVAVDLTATYTTDRIVIESGDPFVSVEGGPITQEGGETSHAFLGGASADFRVHPEGTVFYEGTVHLIPKLYVEFLGQQIAIPVADFPVDVPITTTDWVFDPAYVHVPLPDLRELPKVLDFGEVPIGLVNQEALQLLDKGEALLHASAAVGAGPFEVVTSSLDVDPGETGALQVRFAPLEPGPFESTLTLLTNDPDAPTVTVLLRGEGVGDPGLLTPYDTSDPISQGGDCSCRAVGSGGSPARLAWLAPLALGSFFRLARRRVRASASR